MRVLVGHQQHALRWLASEELRRVRLTVSAIENKLLFVGETSPKTVLSSLRGTANITDDRLAMLLDFAQTKNFAWSPGLEEFEEEIVGIDFDGNLESLVLDSDLVSIANHRGSDVFVGEARNDVWNRFFRPVLPVSNQVTITDQHVPSLLLNARDPIDFWMSQLSRDFEGVLRVRTVWPSEGGYSTMRKEELAERVLQRLVELADRFGLRGDIRLEIFSHMPHNRWISIHFPGARNNFLAVSLPHGLETFRGEVAREPAILKSSDTTAYSSISNSAAWSPNLNNLTTKQKLPTKNGGFAYLSF